MRFPKNLADLNERYSAHAVRPLFADDVSPEALQEARTRVLNAQARQSGLPPPEIKPATLPPDIKRGSSPNRVPAASVESAGEDQGGTIVHGLLPSTSPAGR